MAQIERKKFLFKFHIEADFGEKFELGKNCKIKIFEVFKLVIEK